MHVSLGLYCNDKRVYSKWVGTPGLGSRLSTYWPTKWSNKWRCYQHTSARQTPLRPRHRVTWIKTKKGGSMKNGCFSALKPERLGLSCKANKCRDAGIGDLGVLTTHEASPCLSLGDAGSTRQKKVFCFCYRFASRVLLLSLSKFLMDRTCMHCSCKLWFSRTNPF